MTKFHADDYVQFLKMITPQNMHDNIKQLQRFNVGEDCPVFDGLYDFCQLSAGGSIGGIVDCAACITEPTHECRVCLLLDACCLLLAAS